MLYLHDVWVNWSHVAAKGYEVPEFEAWRKDDAVELIDQTPLLYLTEELFDYIENSLEEIPQPILDAIEEKSYMRKNHERNKVKYMAVITDGMRVMAFNATDWEFAELKSRLIPRQYQLVMEMIDGYEPDDFGAEITEIPVDNSTDFKLTNIENIHMIGLTRREQELKQLLVDYIYRLSLSENLNEVRYWYTELFPGSVVDITTENWSIEKMVLDMHDHLSEGWDEQHWNIGEKLAKYWDEGEIWSTTSEGVYKATGVKAI